MTILITGANRGIGLAMAELAASRGETVIGTYRGEVAPRQAGIDWQRLDVADPASHKALAQRLSQTALSLLVCNAGVFLDRNQKLDAGYGKPLWDDEFAVNVTGVFLTIQSLLPNLRRTKGKIAILSSQLASQTQASGGNYIYRASKAAVLNLGRNLAVDLASQEIAVGIYHPGWVQTDMGGASAAITPAQSASGLLARFAALDLASTGCFQTWDGRPHAY
ncbi:MAG: SDR family NAD(P)-dependent oxidoreductase [Hyphomicrobiales bacterium]|nr:SDR family NAD(P)-dependent oxidoreductase [Hyphomicrobiales bacterium]MDE2115965.1 SDR family NAD(P)-dependent oxidoreductase [Hyphomicrobiales bacterium]